VRPRPRRGRPRTDQRRRGAPRARRGRTGSSPSSAQAAIAVENALLHERVQRVSDELRRYVVDLARATRLAPGVQLGASPRASLALMAAAQALALVDGQAFVSPEHVQEMAGPVLAHRLAIDPQARFAGRTTDAIVEEIVKSVSVPA